MKNENKKGSVSRFAYSAILIALSQVFIACGGGGGGNSPAVTPLPIGPGIGGINSFNYSICGSGTPGLITCGIGSIPPYLGAPGLELVMAVSNATGQPAYGGIDGYVGPVTVTGAINVLPGYTCPTMTSYSFSGNLVYNSRGINEFLGTVTSTNTATGIASSLQIQFQGAFLTPGGGVSSTGQSFPYRIMGPVQILSTGSGGYPYPGMQGQCSLISGQYSF